MTRFDYETETAFRTDVFGSQVQIREINLSLGDHHDEDDHHDGDDHHDMDDDHHDDEDHHHEDESREIELLVFDEGEDYQLSSYRIYESEPMEELSEEILLTEDISKYNDTFFQQTLYLTNNIEEDNLKLSINQYFGFNGTETVWWRAHISNSDSEYDVRRENEFNLNSEL